MREKRVPKPGKGTIKPKDVAVEFSNFGPVVSGEIALRPLTILIGPNNCGKSYTAMLMKAVLSQTTGAPPIDRLDIRRMGHPFRFSPFFRPSITATGSLARSNMYIDFIKKVQNLEVGDCCDVPKTLVKDLGRLILREVFEGHFKDEVVRIFGAKMTELQRINGEALELKIRIGSTDVTLKPEGKGLKIITFPKLDHRLRIRVDVLKRPEGYNIEVEDDTITIVLSKDLSGGGGESSHFSRLLMPRVIELVMKSLLLSSGYTDCYYLPAARSGMMQAHKVVSAAIMKTAGLGGIDEIRIPQLSGIVVDFLTQLNNLDPDRGPLYRIASSFEKEVLGGQVKFRTVDDYISKIEYHLGKSHMPLHRTSSTVSELAPLFLFLKHEVSRRSLLIIEEPEAHLHPANQEIMARLIVRLVRNGVHVMITTHSDLLLRRISDFILLSEAEDQQRSRLSEYDEDDFLNKDEVSVSAFEYVDDASAYRIKPVKIHAESGISQEEFMRIHRLLYSKRLRIERELGIIQ